MFEEAIKRLRQSESFVSMGLGIVVVLVVGVLIYRNFSQINRPKEQTKTETTEEAKPEQEISISAILPAQYTVVAGDDLWIIAGKFYKDSYKWVEIAKENKLANPDLIHPGNVLTIPKIEAPVATGLPETGIIGEKGETALPSNAITGDSYTVQKGDYLWDIAVRAYGDGFMINKIIEANNITVPNLIFAGDVLKIPR